MAQLTIGVKVNSGQLKTLQKNVDLTVDKVNKLNTALQSIGKATNPVGIKEAAAQMSKLESMAKTVQGSIGHIGQDVVTSGLDAINGKLAEIENSARSSDGVISQIGQATTTVGLDAINAKLGQLVDIANDVKGNITKIGSNVDSSGIDALGSKIDGLSSQIGGQLGGAINSVFSALGAKSLGDLTVLNAMDKQTNKVLVKNLGDNAKQAESYWKTIDNATNNSLISMRAAVPALNSIQRATGATGTEMEKAAPNILAFGTYVESLNMPGRDTTTVLQGLAKGIKGAYALLDDFGVTEQNLMDTGLWSGREDDINGFINAINKATGATEMQGQLMQTDAAKLKLMYKQLSVEGAKFGMEIMNGLRPIIQGFLDLNKATGGVPAKLMLIAGGGAVAISALAPLLSSIKSIGSFFGGVGKAAPAMGKGAGSMNLMAKYMQIGSMGIQQMVVPMLKIAVVVAIALPVAAALAAEAMVLLKLLQMLFKALAFDKINIGKSVDSIFDLAKGFAGMALAFGALTVVNIANVVYSATGGILGTIAALTHFKSTIAVSIPIINEIAAMGDINSNIATKINQFNKAMTEIVSAIKSMDSLSSTQFNWNPLTNYTKAIEQAKSDIMGSVATINSMSTMANVNQTAVTKIKAISTALKDVAEAVKSMDSVSSAQFNWNPLTNFTKALDQARSDIGHASESLRGYDTLANIPSTASTKIKATADALKNVATAIKSLDEVSQAQFNWNPLTNFIKAMEQARYDIGQSSIILAGYSTLANIPEGVGGKIQRVSWTLNTVKTALTNLGNLNNTTIELDLSGFLSRLQTVRTDIGHASVILAGFSTIANMPEGVGGKLQRMGWTMHTVKAAIDNLATLNGATVSIDLSGFIGRLQSVRTQIGQASIILAGFNTIAVINSDAVSKVNSVKTVSTSVTQAVNSLNTIPAPTNSNVQKAVTTIKKAMTELKKLGNGKVDVSGAANSVKTAISQITSALNQSGNVKSAATNLGRSISTGLRTGTSNLRSVASSAIQAGVSAISGKASAAWTAGSKVGSAAVRGFKDGLNSGSPGDIARIMAKEIGVYVPQLVWRQIGAVQSMMIRVGKEATKATEKGAGVGSPGDIAKIYKQEVGKYIPMMIRAGIPAVKQALSELAAVGTTEILKGLKISDVFKDMNMFRTVSNYFIDVVSKIQEVTKKTVASKTATQSYVQAWIDGANKVIAAEKKTRSEFFKTNKTILAMKKATQGSGKKKKLIFDSADLNLLKAINAETTKLTNKFLKLGKKGADKGQYAAVAKVAKSTTTALKQLRDTNYANDSAALNKLWKAYDVYYKKLDKAEKKKAKTAISNIKKQIAEQKKAITTAIGEMSTAVADIKASALVEKNLRSIVGSQAEIDKYSKSLLNAQQAYDNYVFNMRARKKGETDSQWLAYQQAWVNQSNALRSALETQQLYFDEAIRKAEDYAMAMGDAADSTSALGDTKEDLMALAKSFNNLNKNTVDLNLNMSGMVDIVSDIPEFDNIDPKSFHPFFRQWLISELR